MKNERVNEIKARLVEIENGLFIIWMIERPTSEDWKIMAALEQEKRALKTELKALA